MNTNNEIINKSSKYPKNTLELGEIRKTILNEKRFDQFCNKTIDIKDVFNTTVSGIDTLNGISAVEKYSVNGIPYFGSNMMSSNRQIFSAHLTDINAQTVQTAVVPVRQTVAQNKLIGSTVVFSDEIKEYIKPTEDIQTASSMNSSLRINNSKYTYTTLNNYLSFLGQKNTVLEKITFGYELLKILIMYDEQIVYPGGLNLAYSGETVVTVKGANVLGNYFPESTNGANPNINVYATTLGRMISGEPAGMTIIPIRQEDIQDGLINNGWVQVYMENPIQISSDIVTTSTDILNTYRTFGNTTKIAGGVNNICFVVVDDDSKTDDVRINIGQNQTLSTVTNNPFLPIQVPVVVTMNNLTGVGGLSCDVNDLWERWCKYYYNSADVEYIKNLSALILHKFPLFATHAMHGGANQQFISGLQDDDKMSRDWNIGTVADEAVVNKVVSIASNAFWTDGLLCKLTTNVVQTKYQVGYTSNRLRILCARGFVYNYGKSKQDSRVDYIYYQTMIQANLIAICTDITRMKRSKPVNYEILQPAQLQIALMFENNKVQIFKENLNEIIELNVGFSMFLGATRMQTTVVDTFAISDNVMECGGIGNLFLIPYLFESFNEEIKPKFVPHCFTGSVINGAVVLDKHFSQDCVQLGRVNNESEKYETAYWQQLLFRTYTTAIVVTDTSGIVIDNPVPFFTMYVAPPVFSLHCRMYFNRIPNQATNIMCYKTYTVTNLEYTLLEKLLLHFFIKDEVEKEIVNDLNLYFEPEKDEIEDMHFHKAISETKK